MGYVENFEKLGFGLFVHFGLYSIVGKGEWYLDLNKNANKEKYNSLISKFNVNKNWAKELVRLAKVAGCKYITLTTRHHDGFSLYDTKGLSNFDIMHSKTGRDIIKEFVDECNKENIVPFFYHTLLDWNDYNYSHDFPKYIDYLAKSLEILCTNYGKIGGFWFDGMWDKPNDDWQEDRIYGMIRKYQPETMIINNTGLSACGKVGHPEIDSVTFERGKPCYVDNSDRHRAGEMCQILNDHWGFAKEDCNYKSVNELLENLVDCRKYNCNFLLNTGLKGNGSINCYDYCLLEEIGKWNKKTNGFIYLSKSCDVKADNADMLFDGKYYYAVVKNTPVGGDENVMRRINLPVITINKKIKKAVWIDNNQKIQIENDCSFKLVPYDYGTSYAIRVAKIEID